MKISKGDYNMKTKIVIIYMNGNEEIVYDGDFTPATMRLQAKYVLKARKDPNIKAVIWR